MRDTARTMPVDGDTTASALRVWHCKYQSLAALRGYPNLRILVIATYPDDNLGPIACLERLEYLSILHLPGVTDLAPLGQLQRLSTLRLSTLPSWDSSGKVTTVESLAPLAGLPHLAHLELFGVRPASKSLRDLEGARSLVSVRVSKYPKPEVRRFYEVTGCSDRFAPGPGVSDWH
jgi:hypothetical protein